MRLGPRESYAPNVMHFLKYNEASDLETWHGQILVDKRTKVQSTVAVLQGKPETQDQDMHQ